MRESACVVIRTRGMTTRRRYLPVLDEPLTTRTTATAEPSTRIVKSTANPKPTGGGIDSSPVRNDVKPVTASATTKGIEVTVNAFATAILSFPPFHGLLLEDHRPTAVKMMAKIRAMRGL